LGFNPLLYVVGRFHYLFSATGLAVGRTVPITIVQHFSMPVVIHLLTAAYLKCLQLLLGTKLIIVTVNAKDSNLTYQWRIENNIIIYHNSTKFSLENNNKTLIWEAVKIRRTTPVYVNVTNIHGTIEKTCFIVHPFCPLCNHESQCPSVPDTSSSVINVTEHSDLIEIL